MMKTLSIQLAVIALLCAPLAAPAADRAGDVVYLKGGAQIERKTKKLPAQLKSELVETDNVTTQERSRVKMLFRDDSILTLGSNSRLVIKQYLYSPENKRGESIYELADGKLRVVVGNSGVKVMTPTAFAAARGCIFDTLTDKPANRTWIFVISGIVEIRNINPEIEGVQTIFAGQASSVAGNEPPTPPEPFTATFETPGGPAGGQEAFSELNAPAPPEPVMPPALGEQFAFEYAERTLPATPPIEQAPLGSTSVSVNVVFP